MKSINFNEATNKIAEGQEEYNTIISQWNPEEQSVNMCFELDDSEVEMITKNKQIWYKQVTFGRSMNPMMLSPFKGEIIHVRKEIQTLNDIDATTPEGKMFMASLAILTTENHKDKTPEETIEIVKHLMKDMYNER